MTDDQRWWADLLHSLEWDAGYWWQAIIMDLRLLWHDFWRMCRSLGRRKP